MVEIYYEDLNYTKQLEIAQAEGFSSVEEYKENTNHEVHAILIYEAGG